MEDYFCRIDSCIYTTSVGRIYECQNHGNKQNVISLFKKGDRNCCENYRGISLTNAAYKLYARRLNNKSKMTAESLLSQ